MQGHLVSGFTFVRHLVAMTRSNHLQKHTPITILDTLISVDHLFSMILSLFSAFSLCSSYGYLKSMVSLHRLVAFQPKVSMPSLAELEKKNVKKNHITCYLLKVIKCFLKHRTTFERR